MSMAMASSGPSSPSPARAGLGSIPSSHGAVRDIYMLESSYKSCAHIRLSFCMRSCQ